MDEALLERYLGRDEAITAEQLHDPFEQALREGHLVPVCFTSALTGAGVPELLKVIQRLMPSPPRPIHRLFERRRCGRDASRGHSRSVIARSGACVQGHHRPLRGQLGVLRVHQGTVRQRQPAVRRRRAQALQDRAPLQRTGRRAEGDFRSSARRLCAVTKVDELHFDAVLHDSHDEDHYHLRPMTPGRRCTASPSSRRGAAMSSARRHAAQAHRRGSVRPHRARHASVNETVLYGWGIARARAARANERAYDVHVKTHPPSIPYRETSHAQRGRSLPPQEADRRRRSVRRGVSARRGARRGVGFEFVDDVVGGTIPGQFIPAVEKGVRQVLQAGALAGYPIEDVRVIVYDGKRIRSIRRRWRS